MKFTPWYGALAHARTDAPSVMKDQKMVERNELALNLARKDYAPDYVVLARTIGLLSTDGANAFYRVLGFLPPTAPIAMPVLYAAGDVPGWQAAVSAVLVAAGTVWMARTAATIYGRSILRTGARVRLRQVLSRGEAA